MPARRERSAEARPGNRRRGPEFEALYAQHFEPLVWFLRGRGCDRACAEDVAQETLLRAFRNLHRYDSDRPFGPWLRTIGARLLANHLAKEGHEVPSGLIEHGFGGAPSSSHAEDRELMAEALSNLSKRQRLALGLRYVADQSTEEAASAMGLSTNAFHQLLHRARHGLRLAYVRITAGIPAAAAVPVRWFGRMRARFFRSAEAHAGSWIRWVPDAGNQVAVGLLTLALVAGPHAPTSPETNPAAPTPPIYPEKISPGPSASLSSEGSDVPETEPERVDEAESGSEHGGIPAADEAETPPTEPGPPPEGSGNVGNIGNDRDEPPDPAADPGGGTHADTGRDPSQPSVACMVDIETSVIEVPCPDQL